MTASPLLLATIISSAMLMGFLAALLPRLRLPLQQYLGMTDSDFERCHAGYRLALIPLLVVAGLAADRWNVAEVLFAGTLFAVLGLAALGLRPQFRSMATVIVLLAAASGCLTTAVVVLMPHVFWGVPDEATASINLGFVAVGLGYLLLPLLATSLYNRFGFRRTMLMLSLAALVPATLTVFCSWHVPRPPSASLVELLVSPKLWLAALVAICYFPLEASLASWSNAYLVECGYNERQVTYWLYGFWIIFLAARLLTGEFLDYRFTAWWVLILALAAAISLGNLAGAYGRTTGRGLLVMGAWLGPLLPTFLGVLLSLLPESPASAVGAVFAVGSLSNLVLQPVTSGFAARHKVAVTIRIPLVLALVMAIPALVLALLQ
jgi:fucose permease